MRHRVEILIAALLFSTGGAAIKFITLTRWQVASFRSFLACAALLLLLPHARQMRDRAIWPGALAYASTLVLFVLASKMTTSANAIYLQSTAPLYLLLLGPLWLREPLRRRDFALVAAIAAGIALLLLDPAKPPSSAPQADGGNLLALLSGIALALMIAGMRFAARRDASAGALPVVAAGNLLAFLIALPQALPVPRFTVPDASAICYLGFFQIGLAYKLLASGMRHVPALEASALLMLEPALNPLWTLLLLGERPSPFTLLGGAAIVGATLMHMAASRKSV